MHIQSTRPDTLADAKVVVDTPFTYVDRTLQTASWWDEYEILPGTYDVRLVNIGGEPWNPDPNAKTPGFIANTGPYWALVTVNARLKETYRENRLLSEVRADHRAPNALTTLTLQTYAYHVPGAPRTTNPKPCWPGLDGARFVL